MWGGKAEIGGKTFSFTDRGAVRHYDDRGMLGSDYRYGLIYQNNGYNGSWYYKFDHGNKTYNPCSTGGRCDGKCNSDFDPNWNGSTLCTGCYNASMMGLAY